VEDITRRQFGLGLIGSVAGLGLSRFDDKTNSSLIAGVRIGAQSYTFRTFTVDRMIDTMKSIGLRYVELWDGHLHPMKSSEADFKAVKGKLDNAGIKVGAYCVNFPIDAKPEFLDRGFGGALLLGTNVMTASVKKPLVPRLDEWCVKYNIRLGLHNHWFGEPWFKGDRTQEFETPGDFMDALKGRSELLSINLDVGHFFAAGSDPVAFFRQHHRRIVSLHLKDRDRDAAHSHRRFGQGAVPLVEVLRLARQIKFDYVANIEYEPEPEDPTDAVRKAFDYVKRALSD
jgi:sugar phosphate isomerase/epimerase